MKSWLVSPPVGTPPLRIDVNNIGIIDAETAAEACELMAQQKNRPGKWMALEWNPVMCDVERAVEQTWTATPAA